MNKIIRPQLFFVFEILLLISIILVILLPLVPAEGSLPSRDSGVFLYTGWRVQQGDVPYTQVWDHKPPIVYYIDALGLSITPGSSWGVWWLELISLGVASVIGYILLKRVYGLFPAIFVSFLWLFTSFYLFAGGNMTEEYVLPYQFLMLWFFYKAENSQNYGWYGFFLGVFAGLVFFTRQTTIAIPLAIGVYLIVNRIYQHKAGKLFTDLLSILAGGLIVTALVVGYFYSRGALQAFWDTAFAYNFAYADEKGTTDRVNALIAGLNQLENVGLAQFALIGWGAALALMTFAGKRIQKISHSTLWMAIIALPLELILVSLGGRPRIPYFIVTVPVLAFFAGFTIWLIFDSIYKDIPRYAGALLLIIMLVALGSVFFADYTEIVAGFAQPNGDASMVAFIDQNSAPADTVLMWGADAAYNFAARRASPTRFVYQTPIYNERDKSITVEFLNDILNKKPRLIILKAGDKLSFSHFGYRDNPIPSMLDQIKTLYGSPSKVGDWMVYKFVG